MQVFESGGKKARLHYVQALRPAATERLRNSRMLDSDDREYGGDFLFTPSKRLRSSIKRPNAQVCTLEAVPSDSWSAML